MKTYRINKEEFIKKLADIGKSGICTNEDLKYCKTYWMWEVSIDEFPQLKNQQDTLINVIKGYHLAEIAYGYYGSPSRSRYLVDYLLDTNFSKGKELYDWISNNGGNYYIQKNVSFDERIKKEQDKAKLRKEIERIHADTVSKRKRNQELHIKKSNEKRTLYNQHLERFKIMNDSQLINAFNEDVDNLESTGARLRLINAIQNEFIKREFDCSKIGNRKNLLQNKIKLDGNKIIIL